jgi:uncharacterized protein YggE
LGLALWISILYPSAGLQKTQKSTVVVTATGSVSQYPAEGVVYVTINGTGKTTAIANDNLSLIYANLNSSIFQYIGKNSSNIQTQYYYTSKVYNQSEYQAIEGIDLIITSSKNISNVLNVLSSINNVYVTQASVKLSDVQLQSMRSAALNLALENATQQAESLTNNATLSIQNITVGQAIMPIFPTVSLNTEKSYPVVFSYGNQGLTETVTVIFTH